MSLIERNPAIQLGEPVIKGTKIRVDEIKAVYKEGKLSVYQMAVGYRLSQDEIYAAINYVGVETLPQ